MPVNMLTKLRKIVVVGNSAAKRIHSKVNRYMVAFVIFVIAITTVDNSNVFQCRAQGERISKLHSDIARSKQELRTNREKLHNLKTNKEGLEKFAREEYLMKRENEDIFIVEE